MTERTTVNLLTCPFRTGVISPDECTYNPSDEAQCPYMLGKECNSPERLLEVAESSRRYIDDIVSEAKEQQRKGWGYFPLGEMNKK